MHCHIVIEAELVAPEREPNIYDTAHGYKIHLKSEIFMTRWIPTPRSAWPIEGHYELTSSMGDPNVAEIKDRRENKFEDTSLAFFKSDIRGLASQHNQPLYISVCIRDVEMR